MAKKPTKTVRIAAMTVSVPPRSGGKVRGEDKPAKGKKGK